MSSLWMDLRFALRTLVKNPAFSLAAVLALTIALGANTAVFSVVNALLNFSLPFEKAEQVAFLFPTQPEQNITQGGVSAEEFLEYQEVVTSFDMLSATRGWQYNLVGSGAPQRVTANQVTPGFFTMAQRQLSLGRGFLPEEGRQGQDRVVIVDHGFWSQDLGARADIVGEALRLDGESYRIVGVAPEDFSFGNPVQLWTPLVLDVESIPREQRTLAAIGRLKSGATPEQATQEAEALAARLATNYPDIYRGWSSRVVSVQETFRQGTQLVTTLLYSAITFVLLIACANVANLLLARTLARNEELALRASLGAGRGQLVRQLLVESLVLAMIGGSLGLMLGAVGTRLLRNGFAPDPNIGFIADGIRLDGGVVVHGLAISVIAALLFGVLPALRATRGNLGLALREGAKSSGGKRKQLLRGFLVTAEVALAMALLITAGTLIRAFTSIYSADPGFAQEGLVTAQVALPQEDYPDDRATATYYRDAIERMRQLPGTVGAAATSSLPLTQFPGPGTARLEVEGFDTEPDPTAPNSLDVVVTPGYFETLEIPLLRGRTFGLLDRADTEPVAVVTQELVERYWPGESGLDRRLKLHTGAVESAGVPWRRIIGVVANHDSHAHSIRTPNRVPQVFLTAEQEPRRAMTLVARAEGDTDGIALSLAPALHAIDPFLPIDNVKTLERVVEEIDTQNVLFLRILSGLALVALLLAAVGIYGVIAYGVTQRRREIGIRTALGAKPLSTISLVSRSAGWLTSIGLLIGSFLGLLLVRFMASQIQGIAQSGASGPATFVALCVLFLLVAMAASFVPTRRALKTNPANVLRDG